MMQKCFGRFNPALVLLVALVASLAYGASAVAAPANTFEVIEIHETNEVPADACGFPLLTHLDGFIKIRLSDSSNNGVFEVDSVHLKLVWENPANGKTSDVTIAQTNRFIDNGDGTITIIMDGLAGRDTIPGAGRVTGDIGRAAFTFDATTGEGLDFQVLAGPHSLGALPGLCQYLA
jgi:hypothetical protein